MLDVAPRNLWRECEAALQFTDRHMEGPLQNIQQYMGSDHCEGKHPDIEPHENHAFDFVTNTLPHLAMTNPQVRASSGRPIVDREICKALEATLNRWIRDVQLIDVLDELALDVMFGPAVALIVMEDRPGYEGPEAPLRPRVHRIDPRRFFQDPQAQGWGLPRFMGHVCVADKADLLSARDDDGRPLYRHNAVKQMATDADLSDYVDLPSGIDRVERHQVVYYEVYVPERHRIYTLAKNPVNDRVAYIRNPRRYFGPPWGCYVRFYVHQIPSEVFPLAPLSNSKGLADELNAHLDQLSRQADRAASFTLIDSTNDKIEKTVKTGQDGGIYAVEGVSEQQVVTVTIPGPSPEQMAYADRLRFRLDRKSGLTQTQQGNLTGVTKGEVEIAQANLNVRVRRMSELFRRCTQQLLMGVAWNLCYSEYAAQYTPIYDDSALFSDLAGETLHDGEFYGGVRAHEDFNIYDLELEIVPFSMEWRDQAEARRDIDEVLALATSLAPVMMQIPFVRWGVLLDDWLRARGITDGRKYFNLQLLEILMSAQLQGIPLNLSQPEPLAGDQPGFGQTVQTPAALLATGPTGGFARAAFGAKHHGRGARSGGQGPAQGLRIDSAIAGSGLRRDPSAA